MGKVESYVTLHRILSQFINTMRAQCHPFFQIAVHFPAWLEQTPIQPTDSWALFHAEG